MENPIKRKIGGYPYFRKPPFFLLKSGTPAAGLPESQVPVLGRGEIHDTVGITGAIQLSLVGRERSEKLICAFFFNLTLQESKKRIFF